MSETKKKTTKKGKAPAPKAQPVGRPTLLTKQLQDAICRSVSVGNYLETACALEGIRPKTFRSWLDEGRVKGSGKYWEFMVAVRKAEAQAEMAAVERIRVAGQAGQWQADRWYLERRYHKRWKLREERAVTGADGGAIEIKGAADIAKEEIAAALGLSERG